MNDTTTYVRPRKFIICVDRFDARGQRVWAVLLDGSWTMHRTVRVEVPTTAVFKGVQAKQPKAYFTGYCRRATLEVKTDTLILSDAKTRRLK